MNNFLTAYNKWDAVNGDPSIIGWFTVGAYALAAGLCLLYLMRYRGICGKSHAQKHQFLWFSFSLVMLALAFNKQLDLQSLFTEIARVAAKEGGWYEERKAMQSLFIRAAIATGAVGALALFALTSNRWKRNWPALTGLAFVGVFVLVRAASFHHVDVLINTELFGLRLNWVFELGGISLVAGSALVNSVLLAKRPVSSRDNKRCQVNKK